MSINGFFIHVLIVYLSLEACFKHTVRVRFRVRVKDIIIIRFVVRVMFSTINIVEGDVRKS